jgi:hypothetical protein
MNKRTAVLATQNKINTIKKAERGIVSLYEKTKQYPSTLEHLQHVTGFFISMRAAYTVNLGNPIKKLPYNEKEIASIFTEAKMIKNFARNRTNAAFTNKHFESVEKAFTTAATVAKLTK